MAFFFFLACFIFAKLYSFYFNHSGTIQSSTVVSYDIINIDKNWTCSHCDKKIEFGLCKKLEKFSNFSVQMLRDMCLLFVKTVVVTIKSTVVRWNTLHKCIVIASREGGIPLYSLYRCVRRQRVCFFSRFGLKKGYQFRPVWSRYVFLDEATSSSLGDDTISIWVLGQPNTFRNSTVLYPTK